MICFAAYDMKSVSKRKAELPGRTKGALQPTPSEGRQTILFQFRIYRETHSLSVMTTGRTELLEHGHRRRIRRGRKTLQGLRAGRSSGWTKPAYAAARGRHDHATFRERADASVRRTVFYCVHLTSST